MTPNYNFMHLRLKKTEYLNAEDKKLSHMHSIS